jgi:murein DD-endopeptidase MepM/ murein hydrolase activator NlpD
MSLRRGGYTRGTEDIGSDVVLRYRRRGQERRIVVRPWVLSLGLALFLLIHAASLVGVGLMVFRDEFYLALMSRQSDMQLAYEARIGEMRGRIDRLAARQLLDRDTIEGQLQDLASRQARLESRSAMVAALAEGAGGTAALERALAPAGPEANAGQGAAPRGTAAASAARQGGIDAPGRGAPSFAPRASQRPQAPSPAPANAGASQRGAALDLRGVGAPPIGGPDPTLPDPAGAGLRGSELTAMHAAARLARLSDSIARTEAVQTRALAGVGALARAEAARLRLAFAELGVHAERFLSAEERRARARDKGAGGPFVPFRVNPDGSPFEREVARMQDEVRQADRLRRALGDAPLGRPLPAHADITSSFGLRTDPFLGRPAHHSGVDFRDVHGAPVRATGAGRVSHAGPSGGYGNLVEIDHGAGLTTRYAHLSAIDVAEGQIVPAGAVVGRLGSTGRSTGPHLHYEVRIDDEPVDPMRFLRAGQRMFARG